MKKKNYIKPTLVAYEVENTEILAGSYGEQFDRSGRSVSFSRNSDVYDDMDADEAY